MRYGSAWHHPMTPRGSKQKPQHVLCADSRRHATFSVMESIFSVASRRGTVPKEFGRQTRDGALKMCWTKPPSSGAVCGSRPNRWVNGTNLEVISIESSRCSVRSMGYTLSNMLRYP
jgi:hypothetical protein